jgi:hypothetical protein
VVASVVAMAVTVASAVKMWALAMASVAAVLAAAVVGSCCSGGGGVGGGGGGVRVTPVTSHPFAAPTAHLEMESCPNTQGTSFTHA